MPLPTSSGKDLTSVKSQKLVGANQKKSGTFSSKVTNSGNENKDTSANKVDTASREKNSGNVGTKGARVQKRSDCSGNDLDTFLNNLKSNKKITKVMSSSSDSEDEFVAEDEINSDDFNALTEIPKSKVYLDKKFPNPTLTFLSSLSKDIPIERCHPTALPYLNNFSKIKTDLARCLYTVYNDEVFEKALPEEMEITWNVRLTKTSGVCYSKRHRNRQNVETRSSRIELSTKVIDSTDRLRDTLVHEMCHAASWIISGYRDGHGPLWKTWAEKAMTRFPELPIIDRCHDYQIRTQYTYKCGKCGYSIDRHSKSIDTGKKVCGHCNGRFQLVVNGSGEVPCTEDVADKHKALNTKQLGDRGDVMKALGAKLSETKIGK